MRSYLIKKLPHLTLLNDVIISEKEINQALSSPDSDPQQLCLRVHIGKCINIGSSINVKKPGTPGIEEPKGSGGDSKGKKAPDPPKGKAPPADKAKGKDSPLPVEDKTQPTYWIGFNLGPHLSSKTEEKQMVGMNVEFDSKVSMQLESSTSIRNDMYLSPGLQITLYEKVPPKPNTASTDSLKGTNTTSTTSLNGETKISVLGSGYVNMEKLCMGISELSDNLRLSMIAKEGTARLADSTLEISLFLMPSS
jgi:hypothetical protein